MFGLVHSLDSQISIKTCSACSQFDFTDNIASKSFQSELCMSPIDIVFTWVNGSDPNLRAGQYIQPIFFVFFVARSQCSSNNSFFCYWLVEAIAYYKQFEPKPKESETGEIILCQSFVCMNVACTASPCFLSCSQ